MADSTDHTDRNARLRETLEGLRDDPDALIEIILRQAEQIRELNACVEELAQKVRELNSETDRLREERDEAEREGKRQAAPFRVEEEKRAEDPESPARAEGHEASYRQEPGHIDRRVEAPMKGCLECGEPVSEGRPIRQVARGSFPQPSRGLLR